MSYPVIISADAYQLSVLPEWGGRISSLHHGTAGDLLVPISPEQPFQPDTWPKAGAYPLIPYHGRIRGAQFYWQAEPVHLLPHPDGSGHSLHGPAHKRPWQIVEHTADSLQLHCSYAADVNWPWDFEATQCISLSSQGLRVTLILRNTSLKPMPAGLGWHPYLIKANRIEHDARRHWPYHKQDLLPTGMVEAETPPVSGCTTFLSDWQKVQIQLTTGSTVHLSADSLLDHLVIHDDPATYTCIEPVSHVAGALSLAPNSMFGLRQLGANQTLSGSLQIGVDP